MLKVVNPVFYCSRASLPVSERILLSNSIIDFTVLVALRQQVFRFLSLRGLCFHHRFMEVNGILSILCSLQSFDRKCMILWLMVIIDERPKHGENATWWIALDEFPCQVVSDYIEWILSINEASIVFKLMIKMLVEPMINPELLVVDVRMTISCLNVINRWSSLQFLEVDNELEQKRITTCSYNVSRQSKSGSLSI